MQNKFEKKYRTVLGQLVNGPLKYRIGLVCSEVSNLAFRIPIDCFFRATEGIRVVSDLLEMATEYVALLLATNDILKIRVF